MTEREKRNRQKYVHSFKGFVATSYANQRGNAKRKGYALPTYTKEWLSNWFKEQSEFDRLFKRWEDSGFLKKYRPSVDRKNDYLSYTKSNIQLMSWKKNNIKYAQDAKNGINNKKSIKVDQFNLHGLFIKTFNSMNIAAREVNIAQSSISRCCMKKRNKAGGFIWKYNKES